MATLRSQASQDFSCEQEAALQTMLQSLLDGAVDEEEADQATAVQEVVCIHTDRCCHLLVSFTASLQML